MCYTRECNIVEINEEKKEVLVHYVGGTEDEDEWVEVQPEVCADVAFVFDASRACSYVKTDMRNNKYLMPFVHRKSS
jgi:hypothetical protein